MSGQQDRQIDTVLNALRHAEPDHALQGRILATLQAAEATQSQPGKAYQWLRPAPLSSAAIPWLAAAALLLAAGGTLLLHNRSSVRTATGGVMNVSSAPVETRTKSGAAPPAWGAHVSRRHGIGLNAAAETHVSDARRGAPREPAGERSFPAPPLPLTEQEKLLLRLVKREPPQQLAQLSQPALDAVFQHETQGVAEFFAPAPPLRGQQEPPPYALQAGQQ